MPPDIAGFLRRFHISENVDEVFTCSCCYWFAKIMSERFPESQIMYDSIACHFVVEIDGRLFDITGDVTDKYNAELWSDFTDVIHKERIVSECIMF